MLKMLFFDYWGIETARHFRRRLNKPVKQTENPLFIADEAWEEGNLQTYGSVIKLPGRPFQLWYSVTHRKPKNIVLCYAESDDGLVWRKPKLDLVKYKGRRTNIVFDQDPHGPAIVWDEAFKVYRMIAGTSPTGCISVYTSADGQRWTPLNQGPCIGNKPDCSMGLVKGRDGRWAAYHRHPSTGRRVCRTTSTNFRFWDTEPRLVFEPDAHDPPQLQFYALGSAMYGPYELGTLWAYHTEEDDLDTWHQRGQQHAELAYSRSGYAWHRAAQGEPFIPHGQGKDWDSGNLQCASQPVYLEDEIRYYFAAGNMKHDTDWELKPNQTAGIGVATLKPDRFISLDAGAKEAELLTFWFSLAGPEIYINADIRRDGQVVVELLTQEGKAIKGFSASDCVPVQGDSLAHRVQWKGQPDVSPWVGKLVRLRVRAQRASLYSIFVTSVGEKPVYHQFSMPF
jgi:hypothetical protein